jgi:twitching motility protein PilJ
MARRSDNSLLNSLKGKIWLATSALAVFVCTFGVVAYLLASFVVSETFYAVFIPFLFVSFSVMVFGWWLSNELVSPIEKVGLLAKSLERSSLTSLPKTTGAMETDEILLTLHRNSQQLQNIVGLMDNVSSGNLDVVLTPLQNSDRLSNSFQKLLAKVSDSIHAKQELEQLEAAVQYLKSEILLVRRGNLSGDISTDFPQTRDISETFNYLISNLQNLIAQVNQNSSQAQLTSAETRKQIQTVIRDEEAKIDAMNLTTHFLKKIPVGVQKFSDELSVSIISANQTIEKTRRGTQAAQENSNAVSHLRKQLNDAINRIQRLNERSDEITKIAKAIGDLAHRTNLIALNASIQATDINENGHGFAVLAEEVERLSGRAENTNKEISSLNKSFALEVSDVENSLRSIVGEASALSKFSVETGSTLSELERYVEQFLNLQTKLAEYSREQTIDGEQSLVIFAEAVVLMKKSLDDLKTSALSTDQVSDLMENLQVATVNFTLAKKPPTEEVSTVSIPEEYQAAHETDEFAEFVEKAEPTTV